jgi:hypothetical protein
MHVSYDIIFDENMSWDCCATMVDAVACASEFIIECSIMEEHVVGQEPWLRNSPIGGNTGGRTGSSPSH